MINRNNYVSTKDFFVALIFDPQKNGLFAHLANDPQLICQQDEAGQTLLHHAVLHNSAAILSMKSHLTKTVMCLQDKKGRTPLVLAISMNFIKEANILLDLGSDQTLFSTSSDQEFSLCPLEIIKSKISLTEKKIAKISANLANLKYGNTSKGSLGFMGGVFKTKADEKRECKNTLATKILPELMQLEMRVRMKVFDAVRRERSSYLNLLPPPVAGEIRNYMAYKGNLSSPQQGTKGGSSTPSEDLVKLHV